MRREADMSMRAVQPELNQVGERVLLRVNEVARHRLGEILWIDRDRYEADAGKNLLVQGIRRRAQAQAGAVGWGADRMQPVRQVTNAVIPETEQPIRAGRRKLGRDAFAQRTIELRENPVAVSDQEGKIEGG